MKTLSEVPIHEHDCEVCIYLASIDDHDLYIHYDKSLEASTLIARHGRDGEYISGLIFGFGANKYLTLALSLARINGLLKEEEYWELYKQKGKVLGTIINKYYSVVNSPAPQPRH